MTQFEVVTELTLEQTKTLHAMYHKQWWAQSRTLAEVEHLLRHSFSVALVEPATHSLVAYSRIVTDYLRFAHIFDVIVDEPFRGKNLGKRLMEAILTHPKLASVAKFELKCLPELEPFYKKCGFVLPDSQFVTLIYNKNTSN